MRGATAPRLLLELIAARVLLPQKDDSERGIIARLERMERRADIAPGNAAPKAPTREKVPLPAPEANTPSPKAEVTSTPAAPRDSIDLLGLRRLWPDVVENVKTRRRLTWSLISTGSSIASIDESVIAIALPNSGARDSFVRSGSEEILRQSIIDIVGIDRKVEAIVDPSGSEATPTKAPGTKGALKKSAMSSEKRQEKAVKASERTDEHPDDANISNASGLALLQKELGAQIIETIEKE
jgi:DNA polymerase-3 subunit gamma/tau